MKKLRPFVTFLLLGVYVLYALSPLVCEASKLRPGDTGKRADCIATHIKLYSAALLLAAALTDDDQDADQDESTANRYILLRKKKAIRSPLVVLFARLAVRLETLVGVPRDGGGLAFRARPPLGIPTFSDSFQQVHSGVSPPLV